MRCVCQQSLSIIRVSIIPSCRLCSVKFQPVSALVQTETSVKRSCQVKYQLRDTVHQQVGRETCCRTAPCIATCNKRENTTAGSSATTVQLSNPQSKRKEDSNHIEDTIVLYYIDSFFFLIYISNKEPMQLKLELAQVKAAVWFPCFKVKVKGLC